MYLHPPVLYLEPKDFTDKGTLRHFKNKTCIVMVQSNLCAHCTDAKPYFQNFAERNKNVVCLTIEGDDNDNMVNIVSKIKPTFKGFPDYLLYKNNQFVDREINGRTEASLIEFVK